MNDTHGATGKGWYGFDLDGTLAKYDKWEGINHIGEPVKPMVDLMKKMHADGKVVKILTARVAPRANAEYISRKKCTPPEYVAKADFSGLEPDAKTWVENMYLGLDTWGAREFIINWCAKHLGFVPEITHEKDHLMLMLFGDRVKQVIPNAGVLVEDLYRDLDKKVRQMYADNGWLVAKVESKKNGFWAGFMLCVLLSFLVQIGCDVYNRYFVEKIPDQVRMKQAHDALCDLLREWPVDRILGNEVNTNGAYTLDAR